MTTIKTGVGVDPVIAGIRTGDAALTVVQHVSAPAVAPSSQLGALGLSQQLVRLLASWDYFYTR